MKKWKPISGYEDYQVSKYGEVRSRKWNYWKKLKPGKTSNGRLNVNLYNNKKRKMFLVHRLVLIAFRGEPEKGAESSHLNGNHLDNRLENLIWESHKENMSRTTEHGTRSRGERDGLSKLKEKEVLEIRFLREQGALLRELAELFKVNQSNISQICRRHTWKHI